jgi:hypothetical protein
MLGMLPLGLPGTRELSQVLPAASHQLFRHFQPDVPAAHNDGATCATFLDPLHDALTPMLRTVKCLPVRCPESAA